MTRRYPPLAVVLGVVVVLAHLHPSLARAESSPRLVYVRVAVDDANPASDGLEGGFLAERYRGRLELRGGSLAPGSSFRPLAEGFHSATDPCFDAAGERLVFSGRRTASDPFQLHELHEDGTVELLFSSAHDCIQPSFLPGGALVFASNRGGEYEEHGGALSLSLHEWRPEENSVRRLSFQPSSEFDPEVLPDGRILHSSWQHVGLRDYPTGTTALLIVNSDGTGIFPFTGNHRGPWMKRGARRSHEDLILMVSAADAGLSGGELVGARMNDPFAPYEVLAGLESTEVVDFAPLGEGLVVVSTRAETGADLGIQLLQDGRLETIVDESGYEEFAPAVAAPRPVPDIRYSTVVEDTPYGFLLVLDVHETDRADQHPFERGEIQFVRVLEGLPNLASDLASADFLTPVGHPDAPHLGPHGLSGTLPTRILGEVPPAEDGSLYLKVPADRPLRLQLVDDDGFVRADERAWFWVRPNERRVCIGCHENRELSPLNQTPMAAARRPTDLTVGEGWGTVSFLEDLQPILDESCAYVGCHASPRPAAALDLGSGFSEDATGVEGGFSTSYRELMAAIPGKPASVGGRLVHPGDARSSPLLWMLYGRPLAAQYAPAPFDHPMATAHPGPMLPESQLVVFRRWVDLGAVYAVPPSARLDYDTTASMPSPAEVRP